MIKVMYADPAGAPMIDNYPQASSWEEDGRGYLEIVTSSDDILAEYAPGWIKAWVEE